LVSGGTAILGLIAIGKMHGEICVHGC